LNSLGGPFSSFLPIWREDGFTDFIGGDWSFDLDSGGESSVGGGVEDEEFEGGGLTGFEVAVDALGVAAGDVVLELVDCAVG